MATDDSESQTAQVWSSQTGLSALTSGSLEGWSKFKVQQEAPCRGRMDRVPAHVPYWSEQGPCPNK